jgi:hypothetical protein
MNRTLRIFPLVLIGSLFILSARQAHFSSTTEKAKPIPAKQPHRKGAKPQLPKRIDYNQHVKPILSDRCFKCHGPDKNKVEAGLQLTSFEAATAILKSGKKAIVPFKPKESELVKRIFSKDTKEVMPSPKSNLNLNDYEKAILVKWIEQGAVFQEHWSFIPPSLHSKESDGQYSTVSPPFLPILTGQTTGLKPEEKVKNPAWVQNPIDFYILKKMETQGLSPAPLATKETLIRRLYFDLIGLPPTVAEVQNFLNDKSPDAYDRLVDQLLASPHFGERLALDWLDVARYADTHGYQDDGNRNAYPYRDWVIRAFNQNLPFDQFVTWQLAGDLLPNPTTDQLIATCFNRNHQQTQEGGVVDEEYRAEYVADRVNTFGKAFLGLTTECARCHTHKYDPISHRDYYALYAFFNQNNDTGIVPYSGEATPSLILPTAAAQKSVDSLRQLMLPHIAKTRVTAQYRQDLENWLADVRTKDKSYWQTPIKRTVHLDFEQEDTSLIMDLVFPPTQKELEKRAKALEESKKDSTKKIKAPDRISGYWNQEKADTALKAATYSGDKDKRPLSTPRESFGQGSLSGSIEGKIGKALLFRGDAGMQMGRALDYDRYQPFTVSIWFKLLKEGEDGPIFNKSNGDFEGYRGWLCKLNKDGTLSFQFNHVWPDNAIDFQTLDKIKVGEWTHIALTYDGSSQASGVRFWLNGKNPPYKLLTDNLQKSLLYTRKKGNWSSTPFMIGSEMRQSIQNVMMDELQIFKRQLSTIEVLELYENQSLIANLVAKENRHAEENQMLLEAFLLRGGNSEFSASLDSLIHLRQQENEIMTDQEEVMIMRDRAALRKTYILNRGAYDAPTEEVTMATPAKLLPFDTLRYPKNRLGLAQWLLDAKNPLFARVMVNRYWQLLFGKGLVATQEDFGSQGSLPTHPELLDYLALDFRALGWDLKAFIKKIVRSNTYRQSSTPSVKAQKIDVTNAFYSHFPAHRLSAELVRDNALAASGLLVRTIGGPSVHPYQPSGIWEALATRNATVYIQNHGDSLYRRSLYTIWKRSAPPPAMLNFDATDRAFCMVRRQKTASPLQSLVLMNDPQFVEAARILAEKMMQTDPSVKTRITYGFQCLTSRLPRTTELEELTRLFEQQKQYYQNNMLQTEKLLSVGEFPRNQNFDAAELAAYTIVASTVMNFDAFVMKR